MDVLEKVGKENLMSINPLITLFLIFFIITLLFIMSLFLLSCTVFC